MNDPIHMFTNATNSGIMEVHLLLYIRDWLTVCIQNRIGFLIDCCRLSHNSRFTMKKLVIIPDSFKGTMSSREVGQIIRQEAVACWPQIETICVEVADGGEGSVDAFLSVLSGEKKMLSVQGPLGEAVEGFYGMVGDTAIIEMAAAAGLPLVGNRPNAGQTTTFGVGQLMRAALDNGAKKIILGLGGSATNDGGTGAAAALGVKFLNASGESFVPVGDTLCDIAHIDTSESDARLSQVPVIAMCDVDNPLCGPNGAASAFGPQKGANDTQIAHLDQGLHHLAEIILQDLGQDVLCIKGAGAAGGMGGGVAAFFGAKLQRGIDVILDTVHFDDMLQGCSLVITGEGRIDAQSSHGKVISGISHRAKAHHVPVIAIVGDIGDGADAMYDVGVSAIFSINRQAVPFSIAKDHSFDNLRQTARTIFLFAEIAKAIE